MYAQDAFVTHQLSDMLGAIRMYRTFMREYPKRRLGSLRVEVTGKNRLTVSIAVGNYVTQYRVELSAVWAVSFTEKTIAAGKTIERKVSEILVGKTRKITSSDIYAFQVEADETEVEKFIVWLLVQNMRPRDNVAFSVKAYGRYSLSQLQPLHSFVRANFEMCFASMHTEVSHELQLVAEGLEQSLNDLQAIEHVGADAFHQNGTLVVKATKAAGVMIWMLAVDSVEMV